MSVASFTNFQPWPFLAGMLVVIGLHFLAAVLVKILHKIFRAPVQRNPGGAASDITEQTPSVNHLSAKGGDPQDNQGTPTQSDASTGTRGAASDIVDQPPSGNHLSAKGGDASTGTIDLETRQTFDFQVLRVLNSKDTGNSLYLTIKPIVPRNKIYAENKFSVVQEMDIIKNRLQITNCKKLEIMDKWIYLNPTFRIRKESPDEDVVISYTERDGEVLKSWTFSAGFSTSSLVLSNNFAGHLAWSVTATNMQRVVFTLLPFKTKPEFGTEEFVLLYPESELEFSFSRSLKRKQKAMGSHEACLDRRYEVEMMTNETCLGLPDRVVVKWKELEIDSMAIKH